MRLIPADNASLQHNNFDAIRLAMALMVVWSHSFALCLGSESTEPISVMLAGSYNAGNLGVMAFFVISGFLVTRSFCNSKSLTSYMAKRVRRIYPGYLVATSICTFVVIPAYSYVMDLSVGEIVRTIGANLLLQGHFPPSNAFNANSYSAVNGSLWSIPYEFWCYIGVATLGIAGLLKRRLLIAVVATTVLLGRVCQDLVDHPLHGGSLGQVVGDFFIWSAILPSFLLGMAAFAWQNSVPRNRWLLGSLAAAAVIAAHWSIHAAHLVVPVALAYGVFYVAFSKAVNLYNAARWGDFSYGTYLYAFPIQQMVVASFGSRISFTLYVILSMCLAVSAGALSWHLVERWFLRRTLP
jgi:peptidoglycan/LPS O-acetylase OafA/YrhL